ncbi:MAG: adenylate/guanylate cyclase domain-containing protein [Bacteroidia bacterium]
MKKILLLLIILFSGTYCHSQNNLDSLLQVWNDNSQSDSLRVDAYKNYIWEGFIYSDPDSAVVLANDLHDFSKEKNYPRADADGYRLQGVAYIFRSNYSAAEESYTKGKEIYEKIGNKRGVANCLSGLGTINKEQGNYPAALDYFQKSLTIQDELDNKGSVAGCLNNIGNIYKNQREYDLALDYYQRSLKIKEEIGDEKGSAGNLHNIGNIYDNLGKLPEALDYYLKAKAINEKNNNKQWLSNNLANIGNIYKEQGDFIKALECYQQCLAIDLEIKNQDGLSATYNNIGFLYLKQGKTALALEYCKKGLALSKEIGSLEWQKSACFCLYLTNKDIGNDAEALKNYEQMIILKDSIYNEENTRKITQLEMQYEFDKKEAASRAEQEKKDAVAVEELRRQLLLRNSFIGGFAVVLLFAGVFFAQRNRIGKEKKRSEELLLNILPEEVADELKQKGYSDAKLIEQVTVIFTDFKGFTALSERITPKKLVEDLHECFSEFDRICEKYGIEKIKTIGDAYMAAGGLPTPNSTHSKDVIQAALEMTWFIETGKTKKIAAGHPYFEIRVGVHTGPVVAGIVGIKKFQYDIWGDTVNTASRMESGGEVGKVNISQNTYSHVKDDADFQFESRGKIAAKGKGDIEMYFVSNKLG